MEPSGKEGKMVKRIDIDIDQRESRRFPVMVLEVKGSHFDSVFFGYANNLSEGGLSFTSKKSLNIGERFPIEFILPDNETKVVCTCEVIWKKKYGEDGVITKGMGVRFIDLDKEKKSKIQHVLGEYNFPEEDKECGAIIDTNEVQ